MFKCIALLAASIAVVAAQDNAACKELEGDRWCLQCGLNSSPPLLRAPIGDKPAECQCKAGLAGDEGVLEGEYYPCTVTANGEASDFEAYLKAVNLQYPEEGVDCDYLESGGADQEINDVLFCNN